MFRGTFLRAAAVLAPAFAASSKLASAQPATLTPVRYFSTAADDLRPFLYAQSAGIFREAGLDVTLQTSGTGANVAQAVIGGATDIGKASVTSIIAAYAHEIPFFLVAPGLFHRKEELTAGICVAANSPLKSVLDLQGKTVSSTGVGSIASLGLRALIDNAGGDSATLKWVELPFSAVANALEAGRVDAGVMGEPAMSQNIAAGKIRFFVDELAGYSRPILEVVNFCTRDYAKKNRYVVSRFAKAIEQGAAYANTHLAETIPLLLPLTKTDPKVATEMRHGYSATSFDPGALQPVVDLMVRYKEIPTSFNARELLAGP
jgi:NitT/TauT family transport system substrate-binding protein